jgi:hypothetical protein
LEWIKSILGAIQRGIHSLAEAQTAHTVEVREDLDEQSKKILDLILQGIKQNNMENVALMGAIQNVSNQLTGVSTDLQNLVTALNAKNTAVAASLDAANQALTKLQVSGRPEDEATITQLRNQLDNIGVHNDDTDAVNQLNDIANRLSALDGAIKNDAPTDTVTTTTTTPPSTPPADTTATPADTTAVLAPDTSVPVIDGTAETQ